MTVALETVHPHEGARPRHRLRAAAVLAGALGLANCAMSATPAPSVPVVGSWQGETTGPNITQLTLYGRLQDGSGHYDITTLDHFAGSLGSAYTPWSGRWVRVTDVVDGQARTEIRLEGALNSEIDRYILDRSGVLEPTPDYVHRKLTRQEIALYELTPVHTD